MKPFVNFKSFTFLAAKSISKAEANSAAENSFNTKQHLNGSNSFNFFFGIKNIVIILIFLFLPINDLKSKECIKFLPFGHNDNYVHLPINSNFCIKYGEKNLAFNTDNFGGRYFQYKKNILQIFGDSQVIGLDIEDQKDHFLSNYFNNNFIIYAAPNNGPYEVINFLSINNNILNKKIVISFNLSVDLFRIYPDWDINNYVAIKSDQLNEILFNPYKYKILVAKSLLSNKFFTVARKNNEQMQLLFMNNDVEILKKYLSIYFLKLYEVIEKLDIEVDYIFTMPYWLYEKKNKKFNEIYFIENKLKNIICSTIDKKNKLNKIYISQLDKYKLPILTKDKRHLKSQQIKLIEFSKYCKI